MSKVYIGNKRYKMYHGNKKVKKAYIGATRVYSAGNICTYHVTSGTVYQEEVDEGASCLSPTSFTPSLSGWTFVGWRKDTTASATVLTGNAVLMGDDPIHLYAVFRQTITISYSGNGNTGGSTASQTGYRYYNNGNVLNATFSLRANGFTRTSYAFVNWKSGSSAYNPGQSITTASNMTMTAQWVTAVISMEPGSFNSNYITFSDGNTDGTFGCGAWQGNNWRCEGDGSFTITIPAPYKKVLVTLDCGASNSYEHDRFGSGYIRGLLGNKDWSGDSQNRYDYITGTHTATTGGTVTVHYYARGDGSSSCYAHIDVKKIEFTM